MSSLRTRIILSTLLIILLITAGSYLVIQDIQQGIIEGEFRDKGLLLANHLALEVTTPVLVNDIMGIRNSIEHLESSYPDIAYVYVTDSEGIVLFHTFEGGFPKAFHDKSKPSNLQEERVFSTEQGIIHEFDAALFQNIGYVHVGVSEERVRADIFSASRKLLLLAISAVALGGVFAYIIGRWLTDPVLRLTEGANRINKGFLDQKITVRSSDELGALANTFNDMAKSLDQKMKDLVTSKDRTETAERYLETLFDSIEDGIVVLNINHVITKTNTAFLKLVGLTEEQVLGKTCHDIIFRSISQTEECPLTAILETKEPARLIHEIDIEGTKRIVEMNASFFLDTKDATNIILVLRDITQEKNLEEEIIAHNKELTALCEISRNISESLELKRTLSSILQELLSISNMKSGEVYLLNEKTGEYSPEIQVGIEENTIPRKTLTQMRKSGHVVFFHDIQKPAEVRKPLNGRYPDVRIVGIPLHTKDKVLGFIFLMSKDLQSYTEQDRALFHSIGSQAGVAVENIYFYDNIKYLKEFNEEILDKVNLAIHVVDRNMNLLAINDQLIKLSRGRVKKEQLIGKNLYDVYPFLKEKHVDKEYEHILKTGEVFLSEEKTEYYGEDIYTSTSKIPIKDREGNVEKIITVMKDVTDRKKLEEELKDSYEELRLAYSKLKELFKIKDTFLSNMSHELRTPLTSIIGFTEMLLDETLPEEQRHKLEIILRNSNRLSTLIQGLLDTTLIESNNLQLEWQALSVYDTAIQVVEEFRTPASIKNIPISVEIPQSLIFEGDKERLIQVFWNILDNALKFTMSGEITVTAKEENECIHVKVSDTGIGIPQDKLELIFDRFYQLEESRSRKHGGTGLGLWVSKNIIEAHGGKIWAESKNRGSTFHILLPKRRKHEP